MEPRTSILNDEETKTQLRRLKEILEKHSYTTETLNDVDTSDFWLPATLYKLKEDTEKNILIRLFFVGRTVSELEVVKIFTPDEVSAFIKLGLLERIDSETWRACIKLFPYKDHILFCDFTGRDRKIERIYQPRGDSFCLADAGIGQPFNCALDLCTGSGIQAFCVAKNCKSVIATDINPRVIHWLRMSLILNERNNVEVRLGDLYDPVEKNRFDYITANPPFVITARPSHKFRDGGEYGDDVLTRVLNGLPHYWTDGGFAQIVTFLYDFRGRSQLDDVRAFAESHQLETLVLKSPSLDKFHFATTQRGNLRNYESYEAKVFADLDHLDRVGMISYCTAVITFKNSSKYRMKERFGLAHTILFEKNLQELVRDFFN